MAGGRHYHNQRTITAEALRRAQENVIDLEPGAFHFVETPQPKEQAALPAPKMPTVNGKKGKWPE